MYGSPEDIVYLIDPVIFALQMILLVALLLLAIFYPYIRRRLARPHNITASVIGLFAGVDDAARSVRRLREDGFGEGDVTVLSSIPYPEGAFETDTGRSHIRLLALIGGITGAILGTALVAGTSIAYPLPTGGKPIVPIPATLVITYEATVLSVMLFSLFRFLYETRLPSTSDKLYDPRIADGMVGVIVRCETAEQARRAEETVSSLGSEETRRVEGRVA
ncbi:MAG TPA: quinol:electron acceptor oxidoreductase subunit ActD [Chloroflexota bacterium]